MTQSSECQGEDQQVLDLAGLNILSNEPEEPPPKMALAREKVLEQAKQALVAESKHKPVHLVVIGHVDAGKSTLMGRLSYDLGKLDEKTRVSNERQSSKLGKGSFSWAWGFDGTAEERERGITMDIAQKTLATAHRQITVLDAPGHKDFIPNVISGASQADCALLVVDASTGEFEAGFEKGGQTREHLVLVRSVGVSQVVVAINKLDQVDWSQSRYEEICDRLKPFLVQTGFQPSKTKFVPVGALGGVNLVALDSQKAGELSKWYRGPTLVDLLDGFEPPTRDITSPMRIPISNVFRHQVSGRLASGIIQIGEKVRVLPGDETAIIKNIFVDDEPVPWAMAGTSVMISLTNIDPFHLHVGSTLCPPNDLVPLATVFTARIITFEIKVPITPGASVELFHHSHDVPATISKLLHILDKSTGKSLKSNPRVIPRVSSAEIQITLRSSSPVARARPIPIEPFSVNKEMGRILIRQGGETIGAGIILDILT